MIGIIPESVTHQISVTMFSHNILPIILLFDNLRVQEGNGILPLPAESRNDFIEANLINMFMANIVG